MESVAKGKMVSGRLQGEAPSAAGLGWAGLGIRDPGWGIPALPKPRAQPWLPGPLPLIEAVASSLWSLRVGNWKQPR